MIRAIFAAALLSLAGCSGGTAAMTASGETVSGEAATKTVKVVVTSANGAHAFDVDLARTSAEQQQGLMYRTGIPKNGGMLFAPYPAEGGGPREASFWMKNTPSPLDIIFIRADGTIARIAENTVPFSEAQVPSGEPVAAVLEINGGRAAELGIAEGDRVALPPVTPVAAVAVDE